MAGISSAGGLAAVSVAFLGPGVEEHTGVGPCPQAVLDVNEICPEALASNTAIGYSGRHDHGSLPQLKNSGSLVDVLSALRDAKKACDVYITGLIASSLTEPQQVKRPRVEPEGGGC
jgi:hypothetical protein